MQKLPGSILAGSIVDLLSRSFECFWLSEAIECAVEIATARLSNNVNDTTLRLAVLRFESCRLHLHLFNERGVDARAQRTKNSRERADAPEG